MNMKQISDNWIRTEKKPTYHGWPTMIRTKAGDLLVVCSGNRKSHICPFGRVLFYRSSDDGATWSEPQYLTEGPLDNRDAGIMEDSDGSLFVNYFTSIAFFEREVYLNADVLSSAESWNQLEEKISLASLRREHGFFIKRGSSDGKKWSGKISVPVNNVHGPVLMNDGSLLWVGRNLNPRYCQESRMGDKVIAAKSVDHGASWEILSEIPVPPGQTAKEFHEVHTVQAADGTLITHIRNHNTKDTNLEVYLWQSESSDGGLNWTVPHPVTYGFPPHLLKLSDGRLLVSYGYRKKPYGNRARISSDHGKTWSEELVISDDGENWDLGYPSSVEMPDGSFITLWYEKRGDLGQLRYKRWQIV